MATIRPKDTPRVTTVTAGDVLMLDGATVRSILVTSFLAAPALGVTTATSLAINGATLGSNGLAVAGSSAFTGAMIVQSASASALTVGLGGASNPAFQVDASAVSSATGIKVTSFAAGSGAAITAVSSGTNESIAINAKGGGSISIGNTSTGSVLIGQALNYGGVPLANSVTGTGSMVLSAAPTLTGALTYGGVTLSAAVTGTGNMVLSTSPTLTGVPLATTAAVDTNTTQIATTAMVLAQSAAATPLAVTNTAAVGTATRFARADHVHAFESTAWTTYTPTVTSGGTITTASAAGRYKQFGKTIHLQMLITVTTAGTGTGQLKGSLPINSAAFSYCGTCKESNLTGKSGAAQIVGGTDATNVQCIDSTATTFIANGAVVDVGITYEIP